MNRQLCTRMSKLEAAWWHEERRRLDAMTDEEIADEIGPGVLEVIDSLSVQEIDCIAAGDHQALRRFWAQLEQWQEDHDEA